LIAPVHRVVVGGLVTLAFTVLARWLRGVSFSGAIAGAVVCYVLYVAEGPAAFATLVAVFVLTWTSTRFGYRRKLGLGTAQNADGRTASQVLANLAVAAGCAASYGVTRQAPFVLATVAALAEAATDTVSSELGQARSKTARLITTWEVVPAGTNGGISVAGTVAGIAAAACVAIVAFLTRLIELKWVGIAVIAGFAGMIADSLLGALLEERRVLNNDWVNFLGTLTAAAVAMLLA